jgi:hypothetical protein
VNANIGNRWGGQELKKYFCRESVVTNWLFQSVSGIHESKVGVVVNGLGGAWLQPQKGHVYLPHLPQHGEFLQHPLQWPAGFGEVYSRH